MKISRKGAGNGETYNGWGKNNRGLVICRLKMKAAGGRGAFVEKTGSPDFGARQKEWWPTTSDRGDE